VGRKKIGFTADAVPKSASGKCETSEHPRSLWQGGAIKER